MYHQNHQIPNRKILINKLILMNNITMKFNHLINCKILIKIIKNNKKKIINPLFKNLINKGLKLNKFRLKLTLKY